MLVNLTEGFLKEIINKNYGKAFNMIRPYFPIDESTFDNIKNQTESQLAGIESDFGKLVDYRLVKVKKIKDFVIRYVYVIRYEKHPVRWVFTYYKGKNSWHLDKLQWDDKIDRLFED